MMQDESFWERRGTLQIAANRRYIKHADGTPFLWLGDTAWAMGSRTTRDDVNLYLDDRIAKGFTIIQAVIHWRHSAGPADGWGRREHNPVNPYGHRPFVGLPHAPDTATPLLQSGGSPNRPTDYWDHIDYIVGEARRRGMALLLLPTWGRDSISSGTASASDVTFTERSAHAYGRFLGERYGHEPHVIWALGGDASPTPTMTYHAMARGLTAGTMSVAGRKPLMTYHPEARASSSHAFNDADWLDMHMFQSGQRYVDAVPEMTRLDHERRPTRPVINGEAAYEGVTQWADNLVKNPAMVRRTAYQSYFCGAAGYTYGHEPSTGSGVDAVWAFGADGRTWRSLLDAPGARQMSHLRRLLEQHEWWTWVPDANLVASASQRGSVLDHVAVRSRDGQRVLVYFSANASADLLMDSISSGAEAAAHWVNPVDGGQLSVNGTFPAQGVRTFAPPSTWLDAVLVIQLQPTADR